MAAGSCPGIAGDAGLDSDDVLPEAREAQVLGARARASMAVAVPLHIGAVAAEVLSRVHEGVGEGTLACSEGSNQGDIPSVRALVLLQHVEEDGAGSGDKDGHLAEDTDLFSSGGRAPLMEESLF